MEFDSDTTAITHSLGCHLARAEVAPSSYRGEKYSGKMRTYPGRAAPMVLGVMGSDPEYL